MPLSFQEKIKGFLFNPTETFSACKDEDLKSASLYILPILLIYSILSMVLGYLLPQSLSYLSLVDPEVSMPVLGILIFLIFIVGVIGLFIGGLWIHLWAYIFGARNGWRQTLNAYFYSCTPSYLLGWIPIINFIAAIWGIILSIFGISELQEIPRKKAAFAIICAIFLPAAGILAVVVIMFASRISA